MTTGMFVSWVRPAPLIILVVASCTPEPSSVAQPVPLVLEAAEVFDPLKLEPTDKGLADRTEKPKPQPPAAALWSQLVGPRSFMFMFQRFVVLETDADPTWETGELLELEAGGDIVAAKQAATSKLPREFEALFGQEIDVYAEVGKTCTGKLGQLYVIALEPTHDVRLRAAAWDTQPHWLIGELEVAPSERPCAGYWARSASLPAPTIVVESDQPNPARIARIEAFRRSPIPQDLFDDYQKYRQDQFQANPESAVKLGTNPYEFTVTTWLDHEDDPVFVALEYGYPDSTLERYMDFQRVLGVEFDPLSPSPDPRTGLRPDPLAVFDADHDGEFELIFGSDSRQPTILVSKTLGQTLHVSQDPANPP
jgi:hypothetical protein